MMSPYNTGLTLFASGSSSTGSFISKRPESYGAKRDGRDVYDAAMTNGSAVLTSATAAFTASDVGKAINVVGAGSAGGTLSTTILFRQSTTQVTLSAASSATISSKQALWGTDDTAAIKSALNAAVAACQADGSCYCEVQFSAGVYVLAGATTKGGATLGNAQIPLPAIEPGNGQKVTIVLRGLTDSGAFMHWLQTRGQKSGVVLRTMLVGQTPDGTWGSPSVIGTNTANLASGSVFSNIRVVFAGITISSPLDPNFIMADMRGAAQMDPSMLAVLVDGTPAQLSTPTSSGGVGLYAPSINNNDSVNISYYTCEGVYYALACSDHLVFTSMRLIYYNTAIYINATSGTYTHGMSGLYLSAEAGSTIIEKSNSTNNRYPIFIGRLDTETQTGTAIKDPSDNLHGFIGWASNDGADPTTTGCKHVKIENANRDRGALTPTLPATTVASTPIFRDMALTVTGGTVTAIAVDGTATGLTSGTVIVPCGKSFAITYSSSPTLRAQLL